MSRGRRASLPVLALGLLGALSSGLPAAAATLEAVRADLASAPAVVLELKGAADYKLFTLEGPRRVVVDLDDTAVAPGIDLPRAQGPVLAVRTGAQPGGRLRVVIETTSTATPRIEKSATAGASRLLVVLGPGEVATSVPANAPPKAKNAAHAPPSGTRDVVIAIDAGHGGKDPGAIGKGGTQEKKVVLGIARELVARLNEEPGIRAILTRDGDYYIAHRERIRRAKRANADMFISIHADALANREVSGASVYVLSERGATDEAARWLAERENAADLRGGVSLSDKDDVLASVLLDLSQSATITSSMRAAEVILGSIDRVAQVRKPKVQQAGFLVLKAPDIPSMLIETAYISNAADERRLGNAAHQEKLAGAITAGVRSYFTDHPPEGTRFASLRRLAQAGEQD